MCTARFGDRRVEIHQADELQKLCSELGQEQLCETSGAYWEGVTLAPWHGLFRRVFVTMLQLRALKENILPETGLFMKERPLNTLHAQLLREGYLTGYRT